MKDFKGKLNEKVMLYPGDAIFYDDVKLFQIDVNEETYVLSDWDAQDDIWR